MIDVRALRENPEPARASQRARGANPGLVDEIIAADAARREALQAFETLRATQKEVSKSVGRASKEERPAILAQAKELAEQVKAAEAAANTADADADRLARLLPNLVVDGVPVGGEDDFVVLRHEGPAPRDFAAEGFEPQDHLALGEGLDAIDTKRGAKVSGARFYYLKGIGARLELALMTMAMDQALANGFVPMMTPTLVTPQVMGGTGFLNEHSDEIYYLPADDLYLTGTSEVALAGYHADEILDLSGGPKRYMGWSTCYRREAGSAGKDTRGIIRVHQFNKAEMFSYCRPEDAAEGFEPQDHLALGEGLDAIDTKRGAKVSGARFYYLKGIGARLELAIMTMAMDQALANGFVPMMTPTLVTPQIMGGTGFLNEHSDEIYYLPADDLYLTGTSEVALAGYHADEILDLSAGPKRYMGWSTCYRREAGSAGKDTRGIIRVHQFNKAEMFSYCRPEDAAEEHQRFLAWEEEMLAKVELPYRVIDTAAGDLGTSAARKFDCEAWLPTQQRYMEVTSTSNCTTFQARRLGIRERREDGMAPVATLNGTLATTRWIVAFLENHQRSDGSVYVPEALRPYLGGLEVLTPLAR